MFNQGKAFYEADGNCNANFNSTAEFFMAMPAGTIMVREQDIFMIFYKDGSPIAWFDLELEHGFIVQ